MADKISPQDLAILIVGFCKDSRFDMTNLRLQKLLFFLSYDYYSQEKHLLFEEKFKAYKFGPVLESVYFSLRSFGRSSIVLGSEGEKTFQKVFSSITETLKEELKSILSNYNACSTYALVEKSHSYEVWSSAYDSDISNEMIFEGK